MAIILFLCTAWLGIQSPPPPAAAAALASGFDHFYNLEYPAALADFQRLRDLRPDSSAAWNHVAQARLYTEMFRIGALESQLYGHGDPFLDEKLLPPDEAACARFSSDNQRAIDLGAEAVHARPNDAHAHYDLGAAYALRGTYEFTIRKSYMAALGDAKRARHEAEESVRLDPSFIDPQIILGAHNYIAGSLPWGAKIFSAVIGYSGDRQLGLHQIANVAEHGETARTDASVLLVVIDRRDGQNDDAARILATLDQQYPRNALFQVEEAESLEAAGQHDRARQQYMGIVEHAAAHTPGSELAPLDKVWYDLGNIDRLYSRWATAHEEYQKAEATPGAQPRYVQAAALAAGEVLLKTGDARAARAEFEHCAGIDPSTPAAREAKTQLKEMGAAN